MRPPLTPILTRITVPVAFLAVTAAALAFAFVPIEMSQDEWWHLKTGKWIWENGMDVPRTDVFAYASDDIRWDNHEWLAQVGMYLAWRAGEASGYGPMRAVITAKALVWLAALLVAGVLGWRRSRMLGAVLLAVILAAATGRFTLQPRPPVLSYLFIALFQYLLVAWKAGRLKTPWLLALPGMMLLWANLHGGFILGGIVIACFFTGELVQAAWAFWRRKDAGAARKAMRRSAILFGIGALTGLCSLATPFGWRLYLLPIRVMRDETLVGLIWELRAPHAVWPLWILWPYWALAIGFLAGLIVFPRRTWAGEALWVAFLFQQSSQHLRHLPLFAIAAIAPCAAFLAEAFYRTNRADKAPGAGGTGRPGLPYARYLLGLLATALSLYFLLAPMGRPQSYFQRARELARGHAYRTIDYPVRLADFLVDADIRGRMINDSRYAGYLIWRLSPERMPVFTDMRYDIFGGRFLRDEMAVRLGEIKLADERGRIVDTLGWRAVADRWNADILILDKLEGRLDEHGRQRPEWIIPQLDAAPDWVRVYSDPIPDSGLAVYVRRTPETEPMIERARRLAPTGYYERPGRGQWGR